MCTTKGIRENIQLLGWSIVELPAAWNNPQTQLGIAPPKIIFWNVVRNCKGLCVLVGDLKPTCREFQAVQGYIQVPLVTGPICS